MRASQKAVPSNGRARSLARKLAMQALYQWQLTGLAPLEIHHQFTEGTELDRADREYFRELLVDLLAERQALDTLITTYADRDVAQLDPVEHAILFIGLYELRHRPDIPYRVVINESVKLCKRFGAEDGHKYVNAVLDRAARDLRASEADAPPNNASE